MKKRRIKPNSPRPWDPEIHDSFLSMATFILYGDPEILPSTLESNGFKGDPYFRRSEYEKLYGFVRGRLEDVSLKAWMKSSKEMKRIWLKLALESKESASVDKSGNKTDSIYDGQKFKESEVPADSNAEYRDKGGNYLTATYLFENREWMFFNRKRKGTLSKLLSTMHREKKLKNRIKVGREYAYAYIELAGYQLGDDRKDESLDR